MYTAACLTKDYADLLRWIAIGTIDDLSEYDFKTAQGETLPHHMTINLGSLDTKLNKEDCIGELARLCVDELYLNERLGVCAAKVKEAVRIGGGTPEWCTLNTKNKHPHITICVKEGVPPKTSNDIFDCEDTQVFKLDQTYKLEAYIKECK